MKIADLINKYIALTIEFRSLKQNKLNKQQAPPVNEVQTVQDLGRGPRESFSCVRGPGRGVGRPKGTGKVKR